MIFFVILIHRKIERRNKNIVDLDHTLNIVSFMIDIIEKSFTADFLRVWWLVLDE